MTAPDFAWIEDERPEGGSVHVHYEMDPIGQKFCVPYVRRDPAVLAELPEVQALIAAAVMEAYALGFDASGEGFNGEFPLDGNHRNVADWQKMRDADLAALITPDAKAALEAYRDREVAKALTAARQCAGNWSNEDGPEIAEPLCMTDYEKGWVQGIIYAQQQIDALIPEVKT